MVHQCLPMLKDGKAPAIVNVASIAGLIAPPFMAAYAASKFALVGYTRALRQELAPAAIHVGLVMPGPVDTPMVEGRLGTAYYPAPPLVPVLSAEQVAAAILRCADDRVDEIILPARLTLGSRLVGLWPGIVDRFYRQYTAGRG